MQTNTLYNMGRRGKIFVVKSVFRCKKCEFVTTRKDELNTHIESKHFQNKVRCPECLADFNRKDSMEHHRRECHPKDTLASNPNLDWVEELEKEEERRQIGLNMLWKYVELLSK